VAGFVAAEDLGDVAKFIEVIDDGGFEETVFGEIAASGFDVVVDGEEADGRGAVGALGNGGEARFGNEEGAEARPVALAGGAGDDVVDGVEDGVDGADVFGLGGGDAGGEVGTWRGCGRGWRLRRDGRRRRGLRGGGGGGEDGESGAEQRDEFHEELPRKMMR